jgi:hypothetical protein
MWQGEICSVYSRYHEPSLPCRDDDAFRPLWEKKKEVKGPGSKSGSPSPASFVWNSGSWPDWRSMDPKLHGRYFLQGDGMINLRIQDTLYSVPRSYLTRHVGLFADMLSLPQILPDAEGHSVDRPIHLQEIPKEEFETLLDMIYYVEVGLPDVKTLLACWSLCQSAMMRWDTPNLTNYVIRQLAESGDHALQIEFARRYNYEHWVWPAVFHMCMRDQPPTEEEKRILRPQCLFDLITIATVRAAYGDEKEKQVHIFRAEMRVRELLRTISSLKEPLACEIPPPQSGYRAWIDQGQVNINTYTPGFERSMDYPPRYVFTAELGPDEAYPGDIIITEGTTWGVITYIRRYHGRQRGISPPAGSILPIDYNRMKWVPSVRGRLPKDCTPVLGGHESSSRTSSSLYHAYGEFPHDTRRGDETAARRIMFGWGSTHSSVRGAFLRPHQAPITEGYHILAWKNHNRFSDST